MRAFIMLATLVALSGGIVGCNKTTSEKKATVTADTPDKTITTTTDVKTEEKKK